MCDEDINQGPIEMGLSRRSFGLIVAATASIGGTALADGGVAESDVDVKTPDGTCDAVLFHPTGAGKHPAVLVWPDIMGLRPVLRDIGRRMAAQGYVTLVPNQFYRAKPAPIVTGSFDMGNPTQRATLMGYRAALTPDAVRRDAIALLAFLDAQPQTDLSRKAGVQGYCMGGDLAFRTAAAVPARIAAVGSFHGGNGLATDAPDSPHLLIPTTQARFLVCQAQNDDAKDPTVKTKLKDAFAAAHRPADVSVYQADHGWCVKGGKTYNEAEAERAWTALTALYTSDLV